MGDYLWSTRDIFDALAMCCTASLIEAAACRQACSHWRACICTDAVMRLPVAVPGALSRARRQGQVRARPGVPGRSSPWSPNRSQLSCASRRNGSRCAWRGPYGRGPGQIDAAIDTVRQGPLQPKPTLGRSADDTSPPTPSTRAAASDNRHERVRSGCRSPRPTRNCRATTR